MFTEKEGGAHTGETPKSVIAAIIANLAVGVVKFIAAAITGSSAMVSEGVHSIVDSGNGALILYGIKKSRKAPDRQHPFGYGKELYFWTLVVSILIFAAGGGVSVMHGIEAIQDATPVDLEKSVTINYVVLLIGAAIEGASLFVAVREFNGERGKLGMGVFEFIRECKDPSYYTVVMEDTAAELGLLTAFVGIFLGRVFQNPYLDGAASVVIGALLMIVASILLWESKGLLVGEGVRPVEVEQLHQIVEADVDIDNCGRVLTLYMGPDNLLITVDASFKSEISPRAMIEAVDRIELAIKTAFPQTKQVFIESESLYDTVAQEHSQGNLIDVELFDSQK